MKKLMFAAVVCAALGLRADVQGANICGYQYVQVPVSDGYYIFTPTFKKIGSEAKFDIKEIKPILPSGVTVANNQKVTLYILDEGGEYGTPVSWFGKSSMWSKNGTDEVGDGEVMVGEGKGVAVKNIVQVNKDGSGVEVAKNGNFTPIQFMVSGEVDLICQNLVPAKNGYAINGNSTPVEININQIVPRLPSGVAVANNQKVTLYMLDDGGEYGTPISWFGKNGYWSLNGTDKLPDADGKLTPGHGFAVKNIVQVNKDGSGVEVAKNGNFTEIYLDLPLPIKETK